MKKLLNAAFAAFMPMVFIAYAVYFIGMMYGINIIDHLWLAIMIASITWIIGYMIEGPLWNFIRRKHNFPENKESVEIIVETESKIWKLVIFGLITNFTACLVVGYIATMGTEFSTLAWILTSMLAGSILVIINWITTVMRSDFIRKWMRK